jgi:hypothetical protein
MSASILGKQGEVLGGSGFAERCQPGAAGPITGEELQELERTARRVATLRPEILLTDPKKLRWRLELQNEQKQKPKIARRHRDRTS